MNPFTTEWEAKPVSQGGAWTWWPVGVISLLSGSRWLLDEVLPSARSSFLSAAFGCAAAAVTVLAWKRLRKTSGYSGPTGMRRSSTWGFAVLSALILCGPGLSGAVSDRHLSANAATIALALSPVVVAVAVAASSAGSEMAGRLWPGLAGVAGLLLLLPVPDLSSWRTDVALASIPLVSGVAASLLGLRVSSLPGVDAEQDRGPTLWIERGLLLATLIFGLLLLPALHGSFPVVFSWTASLADGALSLLTLWTLQRAGAMRWSAQFLLTPLVTLLEGVVVLRPTLTSRSWAGLLLLLLGGVYLLLPRAKE